MKISRSIFFLGVLLFTMNACSPRLSPFTQRLYDDNNWTETDLKRIQFYLSQDITLQREATSGQSTIESGEIKMVDGRKVEEVVVRKGTPGVLIFMPKRNRLAVSFESSGDDRYLMFGPNPKAGNRYVLLASDWKRRRGKVTYDGKAYFTPSESAYAALMVDLKKVRKVSVKSRTAKGRKID
ncbi:MAG: hypothetical protein AAF985_01460 [Bacteroidota bacterium]